MQKIKFVVTLLAVLMIPVVVKADTSTYQYYVGTLTGCNNAPLNAGAVCEVGTSTWGFTLLTLEFIYTDHAAGEGTGYTATLQGCNEGFGAANCTDASDWTAIAAESIAGGVVTISDAIITRSLDMSNQLFWSTGINYKRVRVVVTGIGLPVAADKITIKAMLAIP